jgi:deoxycytidine triphosphate deaminase
MAIVSLLDRITQDQNKFESFKLSDASLIFCDAKTVEPFSVVLTVGDQWAGNISRSDPAMYLIERGIINIPPLSSVVIEVNETLSVPYNVFGIIMQKGSAFLEDGLILASGKVDPSFSGQIQLLIFNSTRKKKTLNQGDEIANLFFFRTDTTIKSNLFQSKQKARVKKYGYFGRMRQFFADDIKYTLQLIVTIFTAGLVAVVTVYFLGV